jgi:hypothetical protein
VSPRSARVANALLLSIKKGSSKWQAVDLVESEISFEGHDSTRKHVRVNGKAWNRPLLLLFTWNTGHSVSALHPFRFAVGKAVSREMHLRSIAQPRQNRCLSRHLTREESRGQPVAPPEIHHRLRFRFRSCQLLKRRPRHSWRLLRAARILIQTLAPDSLPAPRKESR